MTKYIYESDQWPHFYWDERQINILFGEIRLLQGKIIGHQNSLGFSNKSETILKSLSSEIVKSSEIEGEILNYTQVRSSIARKLGINTSGLVSSTRHIDGIVEMMLDATQHYNNPLTKERLSGWHAALFPLGYSGPYKIEAGKYRTGEMQIVSGAMGKEKVHYEAIPANQVEQEMSTFLEWLNYGNDIDLVLKAAVAHFWFIIIHPFDDGNGRIARAITDMLLARSENSSERFYSLSEQMLIEKKEYYGVLHRVQHSRGDISEWMVWFLNCLKKALERTESIFESTLSKAEFWKLHDSTEINERQRLMLNKLLDGFDGKLKTSKWAKITKTSRDTALRDIQDLIKKNILRQSDEGGRSVNYVLVDF